ncbi:MAG TPA: rod shape-determining protein RodA [Solirubrobacteraceae bacterium]|nr:rod shape-determining protein RodA [Solirubrobacteraceae bacterium]
MSPLSPIQAPEEAPLSPTRTLRLPFDPLLTITVIGLGICSIVTLRGATRNLIPSDPHYYVDRQVIYLVVGFVLMLGLANIDYAALRRLKNLLYGTLLFSILAVLALGRSAKGSLRAINLPLFSFQASELGKVLLIVSLAALLVERSRRIGDRDTTVRLMIAALIPAMLVIAQPDLGSGLVYMTIAYLLLVVAGTSWRQLGALVALVCVAAAFVLVAAPAAGVHVLKSYEVNRLTAFLHPSSNPNKEGYQQAQSQIAIGSGQKTGRGANATQVPLGYVPESHTDFVFAAVAERYGFVGAGLVLALYALLIWRTLRVLVMAKDLFGSLIAAGVAAMLMFQVFVNVGMTIGIMPITGVTLPLMSYGGSSVITTLLAIGLLQSIYVQARASASLKGRVPRL